MKIMATRRELIDLYKSKSTVEIGKMFSCSPQAVMYRLKRYGVVLRDTKNAAHLKSIRVLANQALTKYKIDKDVLRQMYSVEKRTPNQIAIHFGCSWDVIQRRLKRYSIPIGYTNHNHHSVGRRNSVQYRKFQKEVLRRFGYKCVMCGYDRFVDACHIKARMHGGSDSAENGVTLCKNHHAEYDWGLITTEQILQAINKT